MSWLQIELATSPDLVDTVESCLLECGALAITLVGEDDEPLLEPAPGQNPLWKQISLRALFDLNLDLESLRMALADLNQAADVTFIGEEDWIAAMQSHAVEARFGERLYLKPKSKRSLSRNAHIEEGVTMFLDPGLAFGSGSHPTTRLCLQWIADNVMAGNHVLDFGCGSGVLGIAAALLGAEVVAVDHDDQAVLATRENAADNGLSHEAITTYAKRDWYPERWLRSFDVVVANILAAPLQDLAEEFEWVVKPGGSVVLSGVLETQAATVMASFGNTRFDEPRSEDGWVLLSGHVSPQPGTQPR